MEDVLQPYRRNLELHRDDVRERRVVMRSMPIWLGLILSTRCNLRCIMCARVWNHGDLSRDIMEKVRPLYPFLWQLQWQGGEVFLVDYFREMFEEAARRPNIFHEIITSGSLIDRDWAYRLVRSRVRLILSIDSVVPATYAVIRRGAELERVVAGLRYLLEAEKALGKRLYKTLHAVMMHENIGEALRFVPFALRYGFDGVDLQPRRPLHDERSVFNPENLPVFREDLLRLRGDLLEASEQARRDGVRFLRHMDTILVSLLGPDSRDAPASGGTPAGDHGRAEAWDCLLPWRGLLVNASQNDGDIMPDCMCGATPVGHVSRDELTGVWNNERMQEYRRRILQARTAGWCDADCSSRRVNPVYWFSPKYVVAATL